MAIPAWLQDAVFYEIYPQSFYDANGDGIGDLKGIIEKLDYVRQLGATAIWLNPCFVSPFQDAGYDVADYRRVAPRYGTNDDLVRLFHEAHRRGLRVILDLVAGHTSVEHPWFKASAEALPNAYSNYYIWSDDWGSSDPAYRFINGYSDRNGNYMINFFHCQPALNYGFRDPDPQQPWQLPMDHPDVLRVREELRDIMKFWLDLGCDGFRVDMASSLVRGPQAEAGLRELWQDYRSWLERNYPEAILVSEWSDPAAAITAGFHLDFMVHFGAPGYTSLLRQENFRIHNSAFGGGSGHSFFDRSGRGSARTFADELTDQLQRTAGLGFVSVPTGNHDLGRLRQGRSPEEVKVALTGLLLLPGVPFLYYGDEIGLDYLTGLISKEGGYNRTGSRTPMPWTADPERAGFSTADPECFYLPPGPPDRPNVEESEADPESILNLTRQLLQLRHAHPALQAAGAYRTLIAGERQPYFYWRESEREGFLVALNPASEPRSARFALAGADRARPVLITPGVELDVRPGATTLTLPPVSYAVYQLDL